LTLKNSAAMVFSSQHDVIFNGHVVAEAELLIDYSDTLLTSQRGITVMDRLSVEGYRPCVGAHRSCQYFDQSAFTGTVLTQYGKDLTL
jgi:hypothetical protein